VSVAAALLALWSVAIEARLVYWQVFRYDRIRAHADKLQSRMIRTAGRRGEIRDRNGELLAANTDAPTMTASPDEIEDPAATIDKICKVLRDCTTAQRNDFVEKVTHPPKKGTSFYVRRFLKTDIAEQVDALNLDGIGFTMESQRIHPNGALAAQVLGFVGVDHNGLSGLEWAYNTTIKGEAGRSFAGRYTKTKIFSNRVDIPPTVGADLDLTIDRNFQYIVEEELRNGVAENKAEGGSVVVMDPSSGDLLAVASEPNFDLDALDTVTPEQMRNPAVADSYEPGSAYKIVTASAALDQHLVTPDEVIDVSNGRIQIGDNDFVSDTHHAQSLSFTDVIVNSSNVGAIKVGLRVGAELMTEYAHRFGFGKRIASSDFPGNSKGRVGDGATMKRADLARMSMGYSVGVTPLQMAAAVSAIANGGELFQPRLVGAIVRGKSRQIIPRVSLGHPVPAEVTAQVTRMMEGVVQRGTAKAAQMPDYEVAGKTGTAARLVGGHYSKKDYNASFVGFVPSNKPAYTIVVVINSPHGAHGYYGGSVSAPIFRRIAERLLRYEGIPPTFNAPPPVLVDRRPPTGREILASGPSAAPLVAAPAAGDTYPDVSGVNVRDALRTMARLGVTAELRGDGVVVAQRPAAGESLKRGATVTLWLGREASVRRPEPATQ
jgi:cell division protein FtsI (penicillin-binding protein 3)